MGFDGVLVVGFDSVNVVHSNLHLEEVGVRFDSV